MMIPTLPVQHIFRPSRARFVVFRIAFMFAAYQVGFTLFQLISSALTGSAYPRQAWLASTVAFTLAFSVSAALSSRRLNEDCAIRIFRGVLEGPNSRLNQRVRFPVARLDQARSRRVSWLNWLLQYRELWSQDGEKIMLFTYAYQPYQVEALYERLRLRER